MHPCSYKFTALSHFLSRHINFIRISCSFNTLALVLIRLIFWCRLTFTPSYKLALLFLISYNYASIYTFLSLQRGNDTFFIIVLIYYLNYNVYNVGVANIGPPEQFHTQWIINDCILWAIIHCDFYGLFIIA